MSENFSTHLSKTAILSRGWKASMIPKLLGDPDLLRPNPVFKNKSPMQLWAAEKVEAVEKTEQFQALLTSLQKRAESSLKAADIKRQALLEEMRNAQFSIPKMEFALLMEKARKSWVHLQIERGRYESFEDGTTAPVEVRHRWCLNFLRHKCSHYEKNWQILFGKVGINQAGELYRTRLHEEIAKQYPELESAVKADALRRYGPAS